MLYKILNDLKCYPQDVCYEIGGTFCRSGELYRLICRFYRYLRENDPDRTPVLVCGHKQPYMVAAFLACACAGVAYVPVDSAIPEARKRRIIEAIRPKCIVDESTLSRLPLEAGEIEEIALQDEDVVYIIFTSGSTGEPKGVQITYRNLKSCMRWLLSVCGTERDVILNQANYSFDLSVADLYLSLLTRSRHFMLDRQTLRDYALLFKELQRSNAGLAVLTPSFLDYLLADRSFDARLMPRLHTVLLCGERLTEKTARRLLTRFPGIRLINSYGPTECTFAVTSAEITDPDDISIGVPKDDVRLLVVDEALHELPNGETGELLILGESVGKGYLSGDDGGFLDYNGQRGYLSGDLGCRKNGRYYCLGRKDRQIKYRGYRIELPEVEAALLRQEHVERAVAAVRRNADGQVRRLLAFVLLAAPEPAAEQRLSEALWRELPEYMLPAIRIVDKIPLTANGKADEGKLLEAYREGRDH